MLTDQRTQETGCAVSWDGEWVPELPPMPPTTGLWQSRLEPLTDRPGEWARFGPFAPGAQAIVKRIRDGAYGPGFESCRRRIEGQDWIFVKYESEGVS